jgi:hypothetical protein
VLPIARFVAAAVTFVIIAPVTGLLFAGATWLVVAVARYYVGLPVSASFTRPLLWIVGVLSGLLMGAWLGRHAWTLMGEGHEP